MSEQSTIRYYHVQADHPISGRSNGDFFLRIEDPKQVLTLGPAVPGAKAKEGMPYCLRVWKDSSKKECVAVFGSVNGYRQMGALSVIALPEAKKSIMDSKERLSQGQAILELAAHKDDVLFDKAEEPKLEGYAAKSSRSGGGGVVSSGGSPF